MAAWWKPMSEPVFARRRLLTATVAALLAGCSVLPGKVPDKPVAAPVAGSRRSASPSAAVRRAVSPISA